MSRLEPENNEHNRPAGTVAGGCLVVAGGEAAELFTAIDRPFHAVAEPVDGAVEGAAPSLGAQPGDRVADAPPPTERPQLAPGVALVPDHSARARPGSPPARSFDRTLGQQLLKDRRLVLLAWGEHHR